MRWERVLVSWMILTFCALSLGAQTAAPVTVRGLLSSGGKAGNLWTLELERPLQVRDPRGADPEAPVHLRRLRFIGGHDGNPQDHKYEGKHVEMTGTLVPPFGFDTAAIRVQKITLLK